MEARISDLTIVRDTLKAAIDAGCDDLISCADAEHCPLPFADLARDPDH